MVFMSEIEPLIHSHEVLDWGDYEGRPALR